jgi:hypothetical protein
LCNFPGSFLHFLSSMPTVFPKPSTTGLFVALYSFCLEQRARR